MPGVRETARGEFRAAPVRELERIHIALAAVRRERDRVDVPLPDRRERHGGNCRAVRQILDFGGVGVCRTIHRTPSGEAEARADEAVGREALRLVVFELLLRHVADAASRIEDDAVCVRRPERGKGEAVRRESHGVSGFVFGAGGVGPSREGIALANETRFRERDGGAGGGGNRGRGAGGGAVRRGERDLRHRGAPDCVERYCFAVGDREVADGSHVGVCYVAARGKRPAGECRPGKRE